MAGRANWFSALLVGALAFSLPHRVALAASRAPSPLVEETFAGTREGGALYARICAGCHLSNGEGAVGAGRYPALVGDKKLEFAPYPIDVVLEGRGAMPPFKDLLDDAQIAAVLNYVRGPTLRNNYTTTIGEADVRRARH